MGPLRGRAGGLGPAPRLGLSLLLLGLLGAANAAQTTADAADAVDATNACPEPPTKELVCYYEGRTPVTRVDSCLCTSIVFTDIADKAGDGYAVDIGVRSQVRTLRKRNPWVRALLQLPVDAAQLKSEERRLRASQAVTAALRKATVDGVELAVDWAHHGSANKTHLTAFMKAVRFQLDSADAVDRRRAKRDYEIFERTTKSMTTTEASTADTDAETDATDSTEPTVAFTKETVADTVADTAGTEVDGDEDTTITTEATTATATTPKSTRTSRAEGSTASDLARQYAEVDGDLDDEDDEPTRILLLQLPTKPELIAKYYDLRALAKQVDWFILPSHNLTDESESGLTFHHSRLMGLDDLLNTDSMVDLLTGLGAPKQQIIVSLPAFALRFTLKDETKDTPRSPVLAAPERLSQQQLCALMSEGGWSLERDQDLTAPYVFKNSSWIAFEDHMSVNIKAKYVLLRDLAGLAVHSVDEEDWLQTSCKAPVEDAAEETDQDAEDKTAPARSDEGQVAGADGDDGSYRGEGQDDVKETATKGKKKVEAKPMPMTLLETAFKGLADSARRTRAALLSSLEDDIHQHAVQYSDYTGPVQLSPYQIVRVVDREGAVHVVRRSAETEFTCTRQGYFRHPRGCNRFYRCVKFNQLSSEFTVFEFDCAPGTVFDETVEVCVWPGSLAKGSSCDGSSEIAPVPRAQYGCPNVEGYYADPENCRWFFACLDHGRDGQALTAYEFRCPFGLVFDEGRQVCNWPWLVEGCGNSGASALRFQGVRVAGAGVGVGVGGAEVNYEGLSLLSAGFDGNDGGGEAYANGGNSLYASGASGAYGASGAAGVYNVADASFQSASYSGGAAGAGASGFAYNGASGYQTGGISAASIAADVNSNLASSTRYGQNNGYIALQQAQDASRYEDRGYGGFATFPAAQVSGGRTQGSSGVVLGSNLHTLQGIQGVQGLQGVAVGQAAYDIGSSVSGGSAAFDSQRTAGFTSGYTSGYSAGAESASGYNAGSSTFGAKQTAASASSGYSGYSGSSGAVEHTTAGYSLGSSTAGAAQAGYDFSSGSYSSSGADITGSTVSTLAVDSGAALHSIQGVQVDSDGSSGYSSGGGSTAGYSSAGFTTVSPVVSSAAYSVTPAPVVVSSTPAPASQSYQTVTQAVSATPGVVGYQSVAPAAAPVQYKQFQLQQPLVPLPAVTAAPPSLVSYQSVFNVKQQQDVTPVVAAPAAPAAPTLYTYKKYEVKQPLVHFQTVTPTPAPAVAVQSYTPTASPAYVSVTPAYEARPSVQPVTAAPAISFVRQETPAPAPALSFVTPSPAPALVAYQQHVVKPGSVDHSVQYSYSSPAPFSLKGVKYHRIVDIKQEPNGYYQNYNQHHAYHQDYQQVKQVQPVVPVVQYQQQIKQVQPVVPVTKVEYKAPVVQYQQYHQEVKQVQPVVPVVQYQQQYNYVSSTPKYEAAVEYQQEYQQVKQVQPVVPVVQYQQQIKQVQPVVPVTKVEYKAPAVQYQQYHQEVKQMQPVIPVTKVEYQAPAVQYQQEYEQVQQVQQVHSVTPVPQIAQYHQEVKQVQPVVPVVQYQQQLKQVVPPSITYQAPAVQYQQQVNTVQPVVPVTKFEYKTPALQYHQLQNYKQYTQEVKQVQPVVPVVQYQQQVKQVQPVVPVVQYQQQIKQVQPVVPVTKVEYKAPVVQYQQQYNYVSSTPKYEAAVEYQQEYQQVKQVQPVVPVVQYQQEIKQVQPVVPVTKVEYKAPAVQYQQQYNYVSSTPKYEAAVEYQQEYQQVKQVQPVVPVTKVEYQQTNYVSSTPKYESVQYQQVQPNAKLQFQSQQYQQQYQQEVQQVHVEQPSVSGVAVKGQEVVYSYSTPSSFPIRQQAVKAVQLNVAPKQYNFVSTTAATPAVSINRMPLLHAYTYENDKEPVTPVPCVTCSKSSTGLHVSSTPAPFQYNYVSSTPKYQAAVVSSTPAPVQYQQQYNFVSSTPKYEAAVEYQQEYQQVKQVQPVVPVVQYQQEIKQVQPVVPVTKVEYKAPAVQYQQEYNFVSSTPKYEAAVVSSTPAPAPIQYQQYNYVSSTPKYEAAVEYQQEYQQVKQVQPVVPVVQYQQEIKQVQPVVPVTKVEYKAPAVQYQQQYNFVSSTPKYEAVVSSTPAPVPCITCSKSSAGLHVSSTPAPFQYNYVSSTPKYEGAIVSQVAEQHTSQYSGEHEVQHQQQQTVDEEPPVALFVQTAAPPAGYNQVSYSTPAPARYTEQQVVYSSTPAPAKYTVVENYSSARPEVYSQQYYSTPAPVSVTKTVVSEVSTPAYVEQQEYHGEQEVEYGAKKGKVVSEFTYVQGQQEQQAVDVYPVAPEAPAAVEVQYQSTPVPVRRLRPSSTAATYVEEQEQQQVVSEGYAGDVVVSTTAAPARGGLRIGYEEGELQQQIDAEEGYGVRNEDAYAGLAKVVESSTLAALDRVRPGRVRVQSGDEGYYSSTTEGYSSSTVRAKGRKRTKIVVVTRISDVNPLLIGKLGAQCSCADNALSARRRRPGVKRVLSRVRVVRPKDGDAAAAALSSTAGYVSSTTEAYVSSTKQAEIEEDLALIRDAEKSDAEEDGDDDANDFGAVVVSSTEGTVSSSAAYEQDDLVSSTVSVRGRSRGRTTYIRAGKAKSTIYVSTTAEPDDDDDEQASLSSSTSRSTVYEVTTASSRRSAGRRTTARSIHINSKDDEDNEDAVLIKPRPRSRPSPRTRSRSRSDNDLTPAAPASPAPASDEAENSLEPTPGPGHTVDLGANGVVECRRPGLFRHPELCNKFYSCNWDKWKKKYAVNVFNCPIHLAYDTTIGACNWPSKGPACVNGKLLV